MKYQVVAFFAGLALVVAIVFGLIGGVSFGLILLRGLLGAIAFTVLGLGAITIFERYLPGLGAAGAPQPDETYEVSAEPEEELGGGNVDIVLPEELPQHEARELGGMESMDGEDTSSEGPAESEEYSELESVGADASASLETETGPAEVDEGQSVDFLPSLDGLDGGATTDSEEPVGTSGGFSGGARKDVEVLGHETDPQEAAKAVRTWLKKDEA